MAVYTVIRGLLRVEIDTSNHEPQFSPSYLHLKPQKTEIFKNNNTFSLSRE